MERKELDKEREKIIIRHDINKMVDLLKLYDEKNVDKGFYESLPPIDELYDFMKVTYDDDIKKLIIKEAINIYNK